MIPIICDSYRPTPRHGYDGASEVSEATRRDSRLVISIHQVPLKFHRSYVCRAPASSGEYDITYSRSHIYHRLPRTLLHLKCRSVTRHSVLFCWLFGRRLPVVCRSFFVPATWVIEEGEIERLWNDAVTARVFLPSTFLIHWDFGDSHENAYRTAL